jgi:hypothetical protein
MIFQTVTALPAPLQSLIQKELRPGETVSYAAQPDPVRAGLPAFLIWLFAIPWSAFSFSFFGVGLWMVYDLFMGAGPQKNEQWFALLVPVFSLPFVAVGIGMLGAPFWVMSTARRTAFVITDHRIFSVGDGRSVKIESCDPAHIQSLTRKERPDGSGTLKLTTGHYRDSDSDRRTNSFDMPAIPQVAAAQRLIEELMAASRRN